MSEDIINKKLMNAFHDLYINKIISYDAWKIIDMYNNELQRQDCLKEHPCEVKRQLYKNITFNEFKIQKISEGYEIK